MASPDLYGWVKEALYKKGEVTATHRKKRHKSPVSSTTSTYSYTFATERWLISGDGF